MKIECLQDRSLTAIAYYRGRWVFVPLFHIPKDALNEETGEIHRFRIILAEGQEPLEPLRRRNSESIQAEIAASIKQTLLPWHLPLTDVKKLCLQNDIPYRWVMGHPDLEEISSESKSSSHRRRTKRKSFILTGAEFRQFLKALKTIHRPSVLIAQIMWYLNNSLNEIHGFLTLQEVLRLTIDEIAPEYEIPNWIRFHRSTSSGSRMIVHYLPEYLWKELCRQIHPRSWYLFSNQSGAPLLPTQIERYFAKAGKKANLSDRVTSPSLRPIFKAQRATRQRKRSDRNKLRQLSQEEWDQIAPIIADFSSKGRKSLYDPKDILNAILYHLTTNCPIRKLPREYPPWQVIDSQYRRWKKSGIIQMIGKKLGVTQLESAK